MAIHVVRLGSKRRPGEGPRLGTVRRPPRGVPRSEFASRDWYDLWLPELAPSPALVAWARSAPLTGARWTSFERRYRREMSAPVPSRFLELLVTLSRSADFSVGCYCEDETQCHRSLLRELLVERGARVEMG